MEAYIGVVVKFFLFFGLGFFRNERCEGVIFGNRNGEHP